MCLQSPPGAWDIFFELDPVMFKEVMKDPSKWCIVLDKTAYGLRDAPLLWHLKARQEFTVLKYKSTRHDSCTFILRDSVTQVLLAILTLHVDDLLIAAERYLIQQLHKQLSSVFGELKLDLAKFKHFGVDIEQDPTTFAITTSQASYIAELKPIITTGRTNKTVAVPPELVTEYRALVSAIAWVGVTSPQAIASASLLQAALPQPLYSDIARVNENLAQLSKTYKPLQYKFIPLPHRLLELGDSSFANAGKYSQNGYLVMLCCKSDTQLCGEFCLLDFKSSKSKRVATSTMHAEALGTIAGIEAATFLQTFLLELAEPQISSLQLLEPQAHPKLIPITSCTDCEDLYSMLVALAQPGHSNKHLSLYIAALREFKAVKRVEAWCWIDTRDMLANGLTKLNEDGQVPLEELESVLQKFYWKPSHPFKWNSVWSSA